MATCASVAFFKNEFIAVLSDGRRIEQPDLREMADMLARAGVSSSEVQFEWQAGQRMITAGQQVAMRAEIRRYKREHEFLGVAA